MKYNRQMNSKWERCRAANKKTSIAACNGSFNVFSCLYNKFRKFNRKYFNSGFQCSWFFCSRIYGKGYQLFRIFNNCYLITVKDNWFR
jgi:hypothetical protein